MFKVKEKVVYPGHGVAIVEEVVEKAVAGNDIKFFKLRFLYKDMTVLVPVNNAPHMAIRSLSSDFDVKRHLTNSISHQSANSRILTLHQADGTNATRIIS